MSDDEIADQSLQFLKEVYKRSKNNDFPIEKYEVGDKLGFDPVLTEVVVQDLIHKQLIDAYQLGYYQPVTYELEITDKGKQIALS